MFSEYSLKKGLIVKAGSKFQNVKETPGRADTASGSRDCLICQEADTEDTAPPFPENETERRADLAAEDKETKSFLQVALRSLLSCPCQSVKMELSSTPARNLDKFIEDQLLPDTHFRKQVKLAINVICSFLKERCFRDASHPVRVSKVVKGGSSGKGTTLRGRSDADLVVFLSKLGSFQEQFDRRAEFIREIRRQLTACQSERGVQFEIQGSTWGNPRALSFMLRSPEIDEGVEFDVLPAFDALGQVPKSYRSDSLVHEHYRPDPQIYVELIQECKNLGKEGEFSTCFTELQRAFLKQRPTKLKSLIRLVKHWYQTCKEELGKPLPQQYALELLTVYAWEQGSKETVFDTAEGFQTVLELVMNYQQLLIYWTKYYDFENPVIGQYLRMQLKKPRPVILDPADPTGNVAAGDSRSWPRLAQQAKAWLSYQCFKDWYGFPVGSWEIQLPEESEDGWTCAIL
ncbi:2'-5'-oligoadenylate synthase 1-like [Phyllostomus discolor]|uniref:2'-5' oligoadenylate synthase n=1 Tax=Phyllostomus discolor TaxID=89673 RepID=A0A7E6DRZ8_9CHIR|nr:2'-5'-oligoadenylate synthase 1-like [Phyllostomus discolor]